MKPTVFRPIRVVTFVFLSLVVLTLAFSAYLTFREGQRLARAQQVFGQITEFQRVHLLVTRRLVRLGHGENEDRQDLARQVDELKKLSINPETLEELGEVRHTVEQPAAFEVLHESIFVFEEIGVQERDSQSQLLNQLQRGTLAQLQIEIATPLALLAVGLLLYAVARRRILQPLDAFGRQLTRVGDGDFTPAPTSEVDPLLLPLHRRFNELVDRLRHLEDEHQAHETSLEAAVRTATRTLLEQQRSLARAERLAATGELAAGVAHELRNPLASIQMTLQNLRAEMEDPELAQRIDRVVQEVERLTRLLNQLLDSARHAPEQPREGKLADVVGDLVELTRHQLPAGITLESRIDPELLCRLPQDLLRQALLNLILNAAAALGEKGTITVTAAQEGDKIRLEVADDGPGLPQEIVESGIRPFFSTRERGTGLGLAIVRRFARDVGGEVTLANRSPHGACITLLLPATGQF